jgi:ribosome-associated protein
MSKAETKRQKEEAASFASLPEEIRVAALAAQDKKAADLAVLDVRDVSSFTDYFIICSGQNQRQVKAIADNIEQKLIEVRTRPAHLEGYERADWILLDYFDFIVHVFTPATREFYALERLWGSAGHIAVPQAEPARRAGEPAR